MSDAFAFLFNLLYNHMTVAVLVVGRAWKVDGMAQALVGLSLTTPQFPPHYMLFYLLYRNITS